MKNISNFTIIYSYIIFSIIFTNLFLLQYYLFTDFYSKLLQLLLRDFVIYLVIFSLSVILVLKKKKVLFKFELLLMSIIFFYLLSGKYYIGNLGVSLKLIITPVLFIMFGKYIAYFENKDIFSFKVLNQIYILFALILSIFMIVELLIYLFTQKYIMLDIIQSFFKSKGFVNFNILPASYKNSLIDFYRISSFIFDPVSASFFFIYPSIYTFYNKKYLLSVIFSLSVLISFSLIALYILIIGIISIIIYKKKLKKALYLSFFIFIIVFFGLLVGLFLFKFHIASFMGHYMSLVIGITKLVNNPFGLGIGGSGYGGMFNNVSNELKRNGDSLVAVFLSDFGIFGILFYYYHIIQLKNILKNKQYLKYTYPIAIVYINLILWSFLSSAPFLLNSSAPFLVLVGYLSYKNKIITKVLN